MSDQLYVAVVDDNLVVRQAIARLMDSMGMPVRVFASASEFLDDRDRGVVGCLVLDLELPGMNGFELLATLAREGWRPPVIVVSAHAEPENVVRALELGAVDFIKKPYRAGLLLGRIRQELQAFRDRERIAEGQRRPDEGNGSKPSLRHPD